MCGIAGSVDPEGSHEALSGILSHRGPDDSGMWEEGSLTLYHWRLAVLDLSSAGHQPMLCRLQRYVICFNGEIYNFLPLRDEIARAHAERDSIFQWRGHSDTEVLVEGFALWGEELLPRLNGMFAIAIYDREEQTLVLARDRMGIKPLYVWQKGSALFFASEAKFFFGCRSFVAEVSPSGLASFFTYGHGYGENRVLQGVRQLAPGSSLTINLRSVAPDNTVGESIDRSDLRLSRSLFALTASVGCSSSGRSEQDTVRNARSVLEQAVERQLVADVPVGVFLSGGVDSSILTALTAKILGPSSTKAFTLGYSGFDLDFNEVEEARAIASHLGVKHYVYEATSQDLINTIEQMVWHYDEPFGDAAALNMMVLSRLIRSEVTVALAGEGSDELFGGYRRYQVERLIRRLGPFSALAQKLVRATGVQRWEKLPRRLAILLRSLSHRTAGRRYSAYFESGINLTELILPEWHTAFDPRLRLEELYPDELDGAEPVAALCHADQQFWLVDTYLEKSDKGSMAHSLEVRVPFLDNEVVEFANSLPDHFRIRGRQGKWLLKQAFQEMLPERVFGRMKRGFAVPLAHWLRKELKVYFAERVLSNDARSKDYLETAVIHRYFDEHQKQIYDRSLILWYVLLFEVWLRLVENRFQTPLASTATEAVQPYVRDTAVATRV